MSSSSAENPPANQRDVLWKGKFLQIVAQKHGQGRWEYVERTNAPGVVGILPVTHDKKVLFLEQFRIPLGRVVVELPAGLVGDEAQVNMKQRGIGAKNSDEEEKNALKIIEEAGRRELLEETGFEATDWKFLWEGPSSAGMTNEVVAYLYAGNAKRVTNRSGDDVEAIRAVHEVPIDSVHDWLQSKIAENYVVDPKIWASLYFYQRMFGVASH